MDPFSASSHQMYVSSGQNLGIIGGKAYAASNVFVDRSGPSRPGPAPLARANKAGSWFNDREMKRKKRILMYRWYAVEGRVKSSFKKGLRWFKRTGKKIIHGF